MQQSSLKYYFSNLPSNHAELFSEAKTPWQLINLKDKFCFNFKKSKIGSKLSDQVIVKGQVIIGRNTKIDPFVVITGPVVIGDNCQIASFSQIRPKTVIGNNVVVGHAAEIKNSFIFDNAKIQSGSFVGDSVIGEGVRIASGVICANRRFDQEVISIKINEKKFSTKKDKFGVIIGDYSRIGAQCTLAPGTIIGQHTWIYPNLFIKGFIESDSLVQGKTQIKISAKKRIILSEIDFEGNV